MSILVSIFVFLVVFCMLYIAPSLFKKSQIATDESQQQNIEIARQRLQEFYDQDATKEDILEAEQELSILLADDLTQSNNPVSNKKIPVHINIITLVLLPIMGVLIYSYTGSPKFVDQDYMYQSIGDSPEDTQLLLNKLEQKLRQQPDNVQKWVLAANIYQRLENYEKVETAYEKLNTLVPNNPNYLAAWADATIMVSGDFSNEVALKHIQKALHIDPDNINALWLAALSSHAKGERVQAKQYYLRLLPLVSADAIAKKRLQGLMREYTDTVKPQTNGSNRQIMVNVNLVPDLHDKLLPTSQLFVIAKSQSDGRIPLAVSRHAATDLPLSVLLTEGMAMVPQMTISNFNDIVIYARVSQKGNPIQQSGDFISGQIAIDEQQDKIISYFLNINKIVE